MVKFYNTFQPPEHPPAECLPWQPSLLQNQASFLRDQTRTHLAKDTAAFDRMLLRAVLVVALAVIPPASAATQITNVCDAQFCLASSPAACGGQCFLTAASGDSSVRPSSCYIILFPVTGLAAQIRARSKIQLVAQPRCFSRGGTAGVGRASKPCWCTLRLPQDTVAESRALVERHRQSGPFVAADHTEAACAAPGVTEGSPRPLGQFGTQTEVSRLVAAAPAAQERAATEPREYLPTARAAAARGVIT